MYKWFILFITTIGFYKMDMINSETYWVILFVICTGFTVVSEIEELLKEKK